MRVAVFGAGGFIGSTFCELYKNELDIVRLASKDVPLGNKEVVTAALKGVDAVVHAAFDHSYKDNISGIQNIVDGCIKNGVKKIIYLSSVSVYDPDFVGVLDEGSPYSVINDPYSKEKRAVEKELDKMARGKINTVILQPSIIYGLGGNWTKYAFHVAKAESVLLPKAGAGICNQIYVEDVVRAIYLALSADVSYEKILISSNESIGWGDFYNAHKDILKEEGYPVGGVVRDDSTTNEFHSSCPKNMALTLWFKTPFGTIFDLAISTLKKMRSKQYSNISSDSALKSFLSSEVKDKSLEPLGITKKVHNCGFKVDSSKAANVLNFEAKIGFSDGIDKIKNKLKGL